METFLHAVASVTIILLLTATGYFCAVKGWMTVQVKTFISRYLMTVGIPVMLIYGKLRTWRPDSFWFRISGIFFTLKVLLTLLTPTIGFLYPVQLIQPLGWGLLSVSSVYYINETMAPSDKVKGQAFFTAVFTLGNVLGNLTAGLLLDHGGVFAMLLCGSIVSAIGAALLLFSGKLQANGEKT